MPALAFALATTACGSGLADGEQTLVMSDFAFTPSTITVRAASEDQVLLMTNVSVQPHDFTVEGLPDGSPVHLALLEDTTDPVRYVLPPLPAGRYEVRCTLPGHAGAGMTGTLVVE